MLPRLPLTLGHENAGRVAAVGGGVQTVKDGDPVAVYGGWGCGLCNQCVTGPEQLCERPQWVGLSEHDGGYAEYLLVPPERYLVKLRRLKPEEAAPLTDAALTPHRDSEGIAVSRSADRSGRPGPVRIAVPPTAQRLSDHRR